MKFCLEKLKRRNCLEDIECVKKYDTTMYRKEVEKKWKDVDWIYLAEVGGL